MPDILLFGATGYTGRLTAHALAERRASFAIAGRDKAALETLAEAIGRPEVRRAVVGDPAGLARALGDVSVLLTCVGPFVDLGETAVEAALRAGVHYIDCCGEGEFIAKLIAERGEQARSAGVTLAPAMAFDEVPADVAATLASDGLASPRLVLTYSVPAVASRGTARSALESMTATGPWIVNGQPIPVAAGDRERWAPLPPPLGPKPSISVPLAELHLAPLHLQLGSLEVYMTARPLQRVGLTLGLPALRAALAARPVRRALDEVISTVVREPSIERRKARGWAVLAEARAGPGWRNVAITGNDVYGLSANLLASGAMHIAEAGCDRSGVVAPTEAVPIDALQKELIRQGASIETFEPA